MMHFVIFLSPQSILEYLSTSRVTLKYVSVFEVRCQHLFIFSIPTLFSVFTFFKMPRKCKCNLSGNSSWSWLWKLPNPKFSEGDIFRKNKRYSVHAENEKNIEKTRTSQATICFETWWMNSSEARKVRGPTWTSSSVESIRSSPLDPTSIKKWSWTAGSSKWEESFMEKCKPHVFEILCLLIGIR